MTISAQNLSATSTKLKFPGRVPVFDLPATAGGMSGPAATRSKYNLVLAFVEGTPEGTAYLQALSSIYPDILARDARVIAVTALPLDDTRLLHQTLHLPFTLLADDNAVTTHRLLGDQTNAALCVADHYGVVYFLEAVPSTADLPAAQTTIEWLDYVQIQCPECTDGSDSRWLDTEGTHE